MYTSISEYNKAQTFENAAICNLLEAELSKILNTGESKIWHGSPVWFLDGNPVAGYSVLKNCVRLLFWSGQSFAEPLLQPEGSFKAAEIRYTAVDQVDVQALHRWLQKAQEIQWDYKHIVKNRGVLNRLS